MHVCASQANMRAAPNRPAAWKRPRQRAAAAELPHSAPTRSILWREVAGDVEDQLRDPIGKGIDLSVGAGHDGHVVGKGPIEGI